MKGGRKNMKRAAVAEERILNLEDGKSFMQVVSLRGSNLIEVMDARGGKSLALFPAKFQKSMWIKRGSFVVVDESGKEKALESGSKVACIVSQVLFFEQVRALQRSPEWPEIFKSTAVDDSNESLNMTNGQLEENELESSDDDGLPPLEANMNRSGHHNWNNLIQRTNQDQIRILKFMTSETLAAIDSCPTFTYMK